MAGLVATPVTGADSGLCDALADAQLPIEDLTDDGRRFFRFELDGRTIGYGGFEPHGDHALIRSIVVLPAARGQGLGRAVAEGVMRQAAAAHCVQAFLLTTSAADFFAHLGFAPTDRADAPAAILATRQAASICTTATLLARRLDGWHATV